MADRLSFQRFPGHRVSSMRCRTTRRCGVSASACMFRGDDESCSRPWGHWHRHGRFEAKKGQMLTQALVARPKTRKPVQPKDGEAALTVQQAATAMRMRTGPEARPQLFRLQEPRERADVAHGFIRAYAVTPASVHDSNQRISALLDVSPGRSWAGRWRRQRVSIRRDDATLSAPWPRGSHALQGASQPAADGATGEGWNWLRSKVRARVEHVFARASTSSAAANPRAARDWNAPRCAWG